MCLVIDTCTLASVFNPQDKNHGNFYPVRKWIVERDGKMVFGGSKYKRELKKMPKYLPIIAELQRAGKCVLLDDFLVDDKENDIKRKYIYRDFDDVHIVAIVIVSRVRIICTNEKRAIPWYKKKELYPKGIKKPKLYTSKNNRNLLKRKHIVQLCK